MNISQLLTQDLWTQHNVNQSTNWGIEMEIPKFSFGLDIQEQGGGCDQTKLIIL